MIIQYPMKSSGRKARSFSSRLIKAQRLVECSIQWLQDIYLLSSLAAIAPNERLGTQSSWFSYGFHIQQFVIFLASQLKCLRILVWVSGRCKSWRRTGWKWFIPYSMAGNYIRMCQIKHRYNKVIVTVFLPNSNQAMVQVGVDINCK